MLLAFLATGDTFEQLGCHFGIGTEAARHYVNEGIDALAAPAPSLADALATSGEERRLLLHGALMSAWRCTSLTTTEGELVFLGEARAGSMHDLTAARADGINESAAEQDVEITADSRLPRRRRHRSHPDQAPQGQEPQRLGEAGQHRPCTPASPRRAALRPASVS